MLIHGFVIEEISNTFFTFTYLTLLNGFSTSVNVLCFYSIFLTFYLWSVLLEVRVNIKCIKNSTPTPCYLRLVDDLWNVDIRTRIDRSTRPSSADSAAAVTVSLWPHFNIFSYKTYSLYLSIAFSLFLKWIR